MSKEDLEVSSIVSGGACIMSNSWRDEQHPSFIEFISSFLIENSYRLNFLQISPDFIVNNGGISIAFIFITNWRSDDISAIFTRIQKLKRQFANLYVVVTLPTEEQNISFTSSYFKYNMELGKPTFVPVQDLEMGFEKIVKIANVRGVCKRLNVISKLNLEREQSVQSMSAFLKVVTSIPGIDNHDANTLIQTVGSIEAISRASKEYLLENTDLSSDKVETIIRFFRDPKYYAQLKLN